MDRQMLAEHIAIAERHVADGRARAKRQRARLAKLERRGHETQHAESLLNIFIDLQTANVAHRDRLREQQCGT